MLNLCGLLLGLWLGGYCGQGRLNSDIIKSCILDDKTTEFSKTSVSGERTERLEGRCCHLSFVVMSPQKSITDVYIIPTLGSSRALVDIIGISPT